MDDRPQGPKAGAGPFPPATNTAPGSPPEPGDQPFDPKPLAAYRLGRSCFEVWLWHNVFWSIPGDESTWCGVPLAVEQLRNLRLILAADIRPNVFGELPRVLVDLEAMAEVVVRAWKETGKYREAGFGSSIVPGRKHWEELTILTDQALALDHPLRSLYNFGAAVGEYQLRLWEHGVGSGHDPEMDVVPSILPLVARMRELPYAILHLIPAMSSLIESSVNRVDRGQEPYLQEYLDKNPTFCKFHPVGREVDIPTAKQFIERLDGRLEEVLVSCPVILKPGSASAIPAKPIWNFEGNRKLIYKGHVARTLKEGSDIEKVLDAFEAANWPDSIPSPFLKDKDNTVTKIAELVKSLNYRITLIKFRADGTKRGIAWRPAAASDLPETP